MPNTKQKLQEAKFHTVTSNNLHHETEIAEQFIGKEMCFVSEIFTEIQTGINTERWDRTIMEVERCGAGIRFEIGKIDKKGGQRKHSISLGKTELELLMRFIQSEDVSDYHYHEIIEQVNC